MLFSVITYVAFGFLLAYLPHWLSVTILTSNVIKLVMGIILYLGAVLVS